MRLVPASVLLGAGWLAVSSLAAPVYAHVTASAGTAAASPAPYCPGVTLIAETRHSSAGTRPTVDVNGEVTLFARSDDVSARYVLERVRPSPAVIRQGAGFQTRWTVRPTQNTSLRVRVVSTDAGLQQCPAGSVLQTYVRPRLTLTITRTGARQYTFSGRVLPGRGQLITLYRSSNTPGVGVVILAQTHVRPDGTYHINRRFIGSGRFPVFTRVGISANNLASSSKALPIAVR